MTQENTYDHETWLERIDAESDEDVFQRIHGKPLKDFSPQILNTRLSLELGSVHSSRFMVISCLLDRAHGTANAERRAMVAHRKSASGQADG